MSLLKEINNISSDLANETIYKISDYMRGNIALDAEKAFSYVYLAYLIKKHNLQDQNSLDEYIEKNLSEQRRYFLQEMASDNYQLAFSLASIFDEKALLVYILRGPVISAKSVDHYTPSFISKLALSLLEMKKGHSVADFGSGYGGFIMNAEALEDIGAYGIELDTFAYEISSIKADIFETDSKLELGNMFSIDPEKKFDRIFSNYPFGLRLKNLQAENDYVDELCMKIPDIKRATSSDWIFNALIMQHLSPNGRAVVIMTNGSTWNSIDQKIRKYFIENNYVETVITLASKLFENASISTTMLVLAKNTDKFIRMIDAQEICELGRRQNGLTDKHIDQIKKLLTTDSEASRLVSIEELRDNDYIINPSRYLENKIHIKDGIPFEKVIKRITRGAQLKATDLDDLVSEKPTDNQYLMLSSIQDGIISDNLPYLSDIDSRLKKYCIENNNLIMSKNGYPYKVAVAEVPEGKHILGNGNLFIIELDESKINPYYLKAFFDSEVGIASLKKITVGATIPNISAESLKKLTIPAPSMEKQNEIAASYQAKLDEIRILQLRLQKAQNSLRNIFGEVD